MGTRRALPLALTIAFLLGGASAANAAEGAETATSLRGTFALADRQYWTTDDARSCVGQGLYYWPCLRLQYPPTRKAA